MTATANPEPNSRSAIITIRNLASGKEAVVSVTQSAPPPPAFLSLNEDTWSPNPTGGSQSVSVTSNVSWTVSSNAISWLTLSPSTGSNNGSFALTATANSTGSTRTGTVTVSGGGISHTIQVSQAHQPEDDNPTMNPTSWFAAPVGELRTVSVTATGPWTVSSNTLWLSVSPRSGNGNGSFTMTASANLTDAVRTATLSITGGAQVAVSQDPVALLVNPSTWSAPSGGGDKSVVVSSNVSWTVSSNQGWLTVSPSAGSNSSHFTMTATTNTSQSARNAMVTVSGGGLTRAISVSQPHDDLVPPISITHTSPGYAGGNPVTISVTVAGHAGASALGFVSELPSGWSYASDTTSASAKPAVGDTGLLEWLWITVPSDPHSFTYTLNVPVGQSGPKNLSATTLVTDAQGNTAEITAMPSPLEIPEVIYHSADTSKNWRIELAEVLRVIAFYNYRPTGVNRTGEYHCSAGTADGFAPGPGSQSCTHHSADTSKNWRIELTEVLRVIAFFNYRPTGGSRTGEYHRSHGTIDGFAPGSVAGPTSQFLSIANFSSRAGAKSIEQKAAQWSAQISTNQVNWDNVEVDVSLAYQTDTSALGIRLLLPQGWTFSADTSTATIGPAQGDHTILEWLWVEPPTRGATFRLSLVRPEGSGSRHFLRGEMIMAGPDAKLHTAGFDPVGIGQSPVALAEATALGDGWYGSPWFGAFAEHADWIYHAEHGWLYGFEGTAAGFFFFDAGLSKWGWTAEGVYPAVHWFAPVDAWAYYHCGGSSGDRWFYDFATAQWRSERNL